MKAKKKLKALEDRIERLENRKYTTWKRGTRSPSELFRELEKDVDRIDYKISQLEGKK